MKIDSVKVVDHPLAKDKLTRLRCKETNSVDFRRILSELTLLMCYPVLEDLKVKEAKISTPVAETLGYNLVQKEIVIIPVMRAGLWMVESFLKILPTAKIRHVGIFRDEKTSQPNVYFFNYQSNKDSLNEECDSLKIILEPMIATGGTLVTALKMLEKEGANVSQIRVVSIIASREGIDKILNVYPELRIFVVALDDDLTGNNFISPGLGDAGDRIFG